MSTKNPPKQDAIRTITLPHSSYCPTKAELEEELSFDCTPEELARRVLQPVSIVRENPRPTRKKHQKVRRQKASK